MIYFLNNKYIVLQVHLYETWVSHNIIIVMFDGHHTYLQKKYSVVTIYCDIHNGIILSKSFHIIF